MTTSKKKGIRYDREVKERAVKMVLEQGYRIEDVAAQLGAGRSSVENWVNKAKAMTDQDKQRLAELESENKRLRKERDAALEESKILKKSLHILAKP